MFTARLYRSVFSVPFLLASLAVAQENPLARPVQPPANPTNNGQSDTRLPAWMKRGLRLSYFQGSASIPAAGQVLVPTANGCWVNSKTGQSYSVQDTRGGGGAGFTQLTFLAANDKTLAVETRMFVLMDPAAGKVTSADASGSLIGSAEGLSEFWLPPAKLAATRDIHEGGTTVMRMRYPLGGREYNAIVVETRTDSACTRHTYDLDSGLLLVLSTSSVGAAVLTPTPNGTSAVANGDTIITSTILTDLRQLNLPWLNDQRPAGITHGRQLSYDGKYSIVVPGCQVFPQRLTSSIVFGEPGSEWAPARLTTRLGAPGGFPQDSMSDRALGAATNRPAWINPRSVAHLERGQVLDEDRVTKFRTTFGGVQGNTAILIEEGPFDHCQLTYDLNTGLLVDISSQEQNGVGQVQIHLQLNGRR